MRKIVSFAALTTALLGGSLAGAQPFVFAANPQHTQSYSTPATTLNQIRWQRSIDDAPGPFIHFGAPVVSANNTVIIGRRTSSSTFALDAYDVDGNLKYTLTTDYVFPPFSWMPPYQPAIVGTRLYYPGTGGKVYYINNVDSNGPHTVNELVFYGASNYTADPTGFNTNLKINTPIAADSAGNIYFGFIATGTPPAPFTNAQGGYARISSTGVGTYILATNTVVAANTLDRPPLAMAPALSNDEQTLYCGVRGSTSTNSYLVGLDATTLAPKYERQLFDVRGGGGGANLILQSTATPMVGPDGDVYLGVFGNPSNNGSRGFLMHFSGDLSTAKTPGAFGWDYTPGLVPASMVPSYKGTSSYLIFCKYNNYFIADGDGVNRVALLDPNDGTQVDFHPSAPGLVTMRSVISIISPTPDAGGASYPLAVREWCINASAVNPSTNSIIFNCEDGRLYRWNTVDNVLAEAVTLNGGIGQPYVPTVIGPDGTVYTLNGGNIFAIGGYDPGISITVTSSQPEMRSVVAGTSITFTAKVNGIGTPTGTFDFTDLTHNGLTPETNTLASNVPVNASGEASITLSTLNAGGVYLGNHLITATYDDDAGGPNPDIEGAMMQKIHAFPTSVAVGVPGSPENYGDPVALTATVMAGGGGGTPTGYVLFRVGNQVLGQSYLDGTGMASLTTTELPAGNNTITAEYESDTHNAYSSGTALFTTIGVTALNATPSAFRSGLTSTGTVTISAAAPPAGSVVALSSNNPNITVPSSVTVTSGNTTANFTINGTNATTANITGTVTATFGSSAQKVITVQPDNRASFISQTTPTSMVSGQSYPVTLIFKNTGTTTWDPAKIKLYSAFPYNNSNFGLNRISLTSGSTAPNANGTFSATVFGPTTPGTYNFQWQCWQQDINMFFGGASTAVSVTVTQGADAARYISRTGATTVMAGSNFYVQNTMKNVGTNTWTSAAQYHMMSVNPDNNTTFGINRLYMPANSTVPPNAQATFTGLCTAPTTPGTYTMQWQCDKNGVPFGDKSPLLNITVTANPDNATYVSTSPAIPTSVGVGTSFTAQFVMQNTGSTTWTAAQYSMLPTGSNNFGVASIASPTVAPSNNGSFPAAGPATFTAPGTPGTYTFQWKMAKGSTTFGQPTPLVTIVVSSGDASQYISRLGATTIGAGTDFYIQNTMKNTGVTTWTSAGGYHMMTVNPNNNTTWRVNRAYMPGGSTIAPGASAAFTALCTAPSVPGSYTMQWQTDKNGTPFGEKSPLLAMTVVASTDNSEFVSQTGVPTTIPRNTTFNATITMKNAGSATWTSAAGYALKSQNPAGNTNWGAATLPVTGSVLPNGNMAFTNTFTAPATPGTYQFQWRMIHGATGFGQYTVNVTITVT